MSCEGLSKSVNGCQCECSAPPAELIARSGRNNITFRDSVRFLASPSARLAERRSAPLAVQGRVDDVQHGIDIEPRAEELGQTLDLRTWRGDQLVVVDG